jgi:predicted permease
MVDDVAWLHRFVRRLRNALRPSAAEPELARELEVHLQLLADDLEQQGLTPTEARIEARRRFGGVEQAKSCHRDARSFVWLDALACDIRYAWRSLHRARATSALVVLTLALGIGAATLLFSVAGGVLLRPLPWAQADRLMRLTETRQGRTGRVVGTVSNGTYLALSDATSTLDGLGGWLTSTSTLTDAGDPIRVTVNPVTPSLFPLLQVRPEIGRLFDRAEGASGRPGVAILSYGLWQERYGGRAECIGGVVQLDGRPYTIVGVMPREFAFPDRQTRLWTAWSVPPVTGADGVLRGVIFRAIARLRAGTTASQAAAEATALARGAPEMGAAARALFGAAGPIEIAVTPELAAITADVRPAILVLLAAAVLLLLTATGNVASIQLARASTRRRELALRAALGSGQSRIVRQLLVENGILGVCGCLAGLVLAAALARSLPAVLPAGFPRFEGIAIDLRAFACALALSLAASVVCGLLPAWQARRVNLVEALSEDGAAPAGGGARSSTGRLRASIVAGQVAIVCVLLVGGVIFTRSFVSLIEADRGYDPSNVLTARLPLPPGYPAERRNQLLEAILQRLRSIPGVNHAAYGTALPFVSSGGFTAFTMRSPRDPGIEMNVQAAQRLVSPDYFAAVGLRRVAGRTLTDSDTGSSPPVVVVNRSFVRQYLGEHPVGFRIARDGPSAGAIRFVNEQDGWEVVGVVDDMRQDINTPAEPEVFAAITQVLAASANMNFEPILVVRTADDPSAYASTLQALVHQEAPTLALDSVMTMEERVMASLEKQRLYLVLLSGFGAVALLIAIVGLFGILSFTVAQRQRELGIRSALGAPARDIVRLVLRQALWMVSAGVAAGLLIAWASARLLSSFLYGVGPHDLLTFALVPLVVVGVATLACVGPARRAATIDPLVVIRQL